MDRLAAAGLALLLAGCAGSGTPAAAPPDAPAPIRVACVGDSLTYGAGVEAREKNNYPAVLGRLLGERYRTRNFGVNGATLLRKGDKPWWNLPEFKAASAFDPRIVVIMLGSNDTKPGNWTHQGDFARDYGDLLDHFLKLPSKPAVWVCLPVPVYETRWGINEPTLRDGVLPLIARVAAEKGVPVIDLHTALSGASELFPDRVHPNAEGAARMARVIQAAISRE